MIFGGLLFSHGIAKWSNFDTMSTMFPDPLGIGSSASLSLAIFGEVICSLGFIVGAFYRLALIPMIFTMCIAFFVIHGADPFAVKELALVYLAIFVFGRVYGRCASLIESCHAKRFIADFFRPYRMYIAGIFLNRHTEHRIEIMRVLVQLRKS